MTFQEWLEGYEGEYRSESYSAYVSALMFAHSCITIDEDAKEKIQDAIDDSVDT